MVTENGSSMVTKERSRMTRKQFRMTKGPVPLPERRHYARAETLYRNISRHRAPVIPDFQSAFFTLKDRYVR